MSGVDSFNWSHYYDLAKKLTETDKSLCNKEALTRSAISRAYFGAFCLARNLAIDRGWVRNIPESGKAHKIVKNYFYNNKNRKKYLIGANLDKLRNDRNEADYKNKCEDLNKKAEICVKRAENIIQLIRSF